MITTIADPYLAQNAGRRYPLADDTPYTDVTSDIAILDFRCTVRADAGVPLRAYLTDADSVTVDGAPAKRLTVTVRAGATTVDTLLFDIPTSVAATRNHVIRATGAKSVADMTVTAAAVNNAYIPNGAKNTPFAWSTVVCDSLKVRSIQSAHTDADARDISDPVARDPIAVLTGEVVLTEGRNTEPYLDGNHLRLDIYKGAGLGENCQVATTSQTCDNVMFTLNGERPGSDGNLRIVGEDGITITPRPEAHALIIKLDTVARDRMTEECASTCNGG